jgi:hypothetical protein
MTESNIKSILAAECGSTTTTAVLIEQIGGTFRLRAAGQAPSTYASPWDDVTLGVQEAIRHVERMVSRILLAPGGWPITPRNQAQQGVDAFVVILSSAAPVQVLVAGLSRDISLLSARRAAAGAYTHVIGSLSLDSGEGNSAEVRIAAVQEHQPEVIILAGGVDGGAEMSLLELARAISIALQMYDNRRPAVLYAGNAALRPQMADIFGSVTALTSVNNVRPTLNIEDLTVARQELERLYFEQKMMLLPGFGKLKNWSRYDVLSSGQSFEKLVAFLGRHHQLNVLGASVGSRSTMISTCSDQQLNTTIRSDVGVGQSIASLLEAVPLEKIRRWLPFNISAEELENRLMNKSLYPHTVPTGPEDLMIEHAVAREALRLVVEQSQTGMPERQWSMAVGAGKPLTGAPQAAHAAMVLLDGVEPWGVTRLHLDQSGVVSMLGAIAMVEPLAAVHVAQFDALLNLGTVVAPAGHGRVGQVAMKVKITYPDETVVEKEVKFGSIELLPLPAHQKARLEIRPARQFDIGLGQPGRGAIAEVEGGMLGLILDARGRPLKLPTDDDVRIEALQAWLKALNVSYAPPVK